MAIVTKTYIEKSNTIFKDECENLGMNPIMELNYGKSLSRGIIYFNHERIKRMVEDRTYPDMSKLRHVLKMTNTASLNAEEKYKPCMTNLNDSEKERAASFDVIFFLPNKEWDGGKGYDYTKDMTDVHGKSYSQEGSNWYKNKNYFKWDEDGIYATDTLSKELDKYTSKAGNLSRIIIGFKHFDAGDENIELDITETVNKYITGELENYGIGIAFSPRFEMESTTRTQYVGFFTQNTHTFFEPYVETRYDETIEDDRTNFYLSKDNRLYFYANVGGKYVNLDEMPTCSVNGEEFTVKQSTKGVYYIEINLPKEEYEADTMMYDVWSNIKYNGKTMDDVELPFVTKSYSQYFSFGLPSSEENTEFIPSVYGINEKEEIKRGEIRKVNIDCRIPYTTNQLRSVDGIEYRLYVTEGLKQHDVISWTKVERGYNENYFLLNTDDLIPSRYYIDLMVHNGLETVKHVNVVEFDIVNEV